MKNTITFIGLSVLFFYTLTKIFQFYGIKQDVYGTYLMFYVFIIISSIILPTSYPEL